MRKVFSIPPTFFYLSIILIVILYIIAPGFNLITMPYNLIGIVFLFIGVYMTRQARDLFKKHKTTHQYRKPVHLITDEIFSKTRNPMYLGMFVFIGGVALCFGNIITLLIPFLFLFIIHVTFIPNEEKILEDKFGEAFIDYKKQVRRWL